MLKFLFKLFEKEELIPEEYRKLLANEFRNIPFEFVEQFLADHGRLPTMEELHDF